MCSQICKPLLTGVCTHTEYLIGKDVFIFQDLFFFVRGGGVFGPLKFKSLIILEPQHLCFWGGEMFGGGEGVGGGLGVMDKGKDQPPPLVRGPFYSRFRQGT